METYALYGASVELTFSGGKHKYTANGEPVESITGILSKVVAKPALIWWASGLAGDHIRANLIPGKTYDELEIEELAVGARNAHSKVSGNAASIGTAVHDLISRHLKGEEVREPINEQIKNGYEAWLRFEAEHDFQIIDSERKVYSKELGVAGTVDLYGTLDGLPVIGDIKTTNGIYPEALLQCGGYDICLAEEDGALIAKHLVISCGRDGTLKVHVSEDVERNRQGFRAAVGLAKALDQISKEIK